MSDLFQFTAGTTPVLINVPHAGTYVPPDIQRRLTPASLALPDTDWHVPRLYDFVSGLGVGLLAATHSRYVIDLNRDPAGNPLYPGADNTELVPATTFAREPVYHPSDEPSVDEIADRRQRFWQPYHERLAAELATLHSRFGVAVLWDAHSIVSVAPRFFMGRLPDLNLGSARGTSAEQNLIGKVEATLKANPRFSMVLDGRFTGGYITRHYGRPERGVHALQLEIAEVAYMDERPPYPWDEGRAAPLKQVLERALTAVVAWARERTRA